MTKCQIAAAVLTAAMFITLPGRVFADDEFVADANAALQSLYGSELVAKLIGEKAKTLTTTTLKDDVYAFNFDQKSLMAGLGLQGSKITKLDK
jgi:hypothetical protein